MSRDDGEARKPEDPEAGPLENTAGLLARHHSGDPLAKERLFGRYLPILQRWAHHRLPGGARDLRDTDDLVQDTLLRAFRNIDTFQHRGEGAFLAYLRQILINTIRDDVRKVAVRPRPETLEDVHPDAAPSALEDAIGRESVERFERALARLDPEPREAVILRIELGFSHQQVADALGKPSADAARATIARALVALTKAMHEV